MLPASPINPPVVTIYLRIVSLLIKYGASPFTTISSLISEPVEYYYERESVRRLRASQVLEAAGSSFPTEAGELLQELRNRNPPRHDNRWHDRRRWERRERISNDYTSRQRRW